MKQAAVNILLLLFAGLIMALSIAGPELLATYRDKSMLGEIHARPAADGKGYRYTLSPGEKLYILSESLSNYQLPESGQYVDAQYGPRNMTYSFIVNHTGSSQAGGTKITKEQVFHACNQGLGDLKDLGILPATVKGVEGGEYDPTLYSAIDVLEPINNVAVWKLSLSNSYANKDKENRLIDLYLDADDGKIYEFYVRTPLGWQDLDPDGIAQKWSSYMGLPAPAPYEEKNPLMETTPFFKKYAFPGAGKEMTIVTIGLYEGINELFLRISR